MGRARSRTRRNYADNFRLSSTTRNHRSSLVSPRRKQSKWGWDVDFAVGKSCSRVVAKNVGKPRQLGVFQSKDDWIDDSGPEPVRTRGRDTRHCRKSGGVLRHNTIRMNERYAHQAPENIRAAIAKLGSLSQFGPPPILRQALMRKTLIFLVGGTGIEPVTPAV